MDLSKELELLIKEKETKAMEDSKRVLDVFRRNIKGIEKLIKSYSANKGRQGFEDGAYLAISKFLESKGIVRKDGKALTVHQVSQNIKQVRNEKSVKKDIVEKIVSLAPVDVTKNWILVSERLVDTMNDWTTEDKKDYYELQKVKSKGLELSYEQANCYDKLLRKKENAGH